MSLPWVLLRLPLGPKALHPQSWGDPQVDSKTAVTGDYRRGGLPPTLEPWEHKETLDKVEPHQLMPRDL